MSIMRAFALLANSSRAVHTFPSRLYATSAGPKRTTLSTLRSLYASRTPIAMLTAYDYPSALHADLAGVDITLVGDSVAMVVLGHRTTQSATLDQLVHHAQAVRRATASPLLVADLPFGTYETSPTRAVDAAVRLVKEAAVDAVKLEGGNLRAPIVRAIVDAGVAVMGHVGLLPQAVSREGAFRPVGRSASAAKCLIEDALAIQQAGAFAIVVECVPAPVAKLLTSVLDVPTIGIGSGPHCDGQVLVYHDMLGILNHPHHNTVTPKFCKGFAQLAPVIDNAIREYCEQVRTRKFPDDQYSPYKIADDEYQQLTHIVDEMKRRQGQHGELQKDDARRSSGGSAAPPLNDDPITVY